METIALVLIPSLLVLFIVGLILLIGSGFVYLGLNTMTKRFNRCPECHKNDAGTIVETVTLETTNHMDYTTTPPRRIVENKLEDHYQCDFCKHTWTRTITQTKRTKIKV